jgi:plasmid maintenance system killer protein
MLREAELTVHFASQELERLYTSNVGAHSYAPEIVKLFRRRVRHIEAATDLNDLKCPNLVSYRRLSADYPPTSSLGLNEDWELIISEELENKAERIVVLEIAERGER